MRIAFLSSGTVKGSLSYRPLAFAKELVNRGHEVYFFAPRFDKYSNFKDEKITEIDGVKVMRPWQMRTFSFELGLIPYMISSVFMIAKLSPDVVHVNKANPVTLPALVVKFAKKVPVVFDTDDADSEVMKAENNPVIKIKLVQFSEKLFDKYADAVTTASKFLFTIYAAGDKNRLVSHIPNGAHFSNTDKIKTSKLSENRIVFVGAMNRKNILEPLFYAMQEMKNKKVKINALIIGDGTYLQYFKKLSRKLRIADNVTFLGRIPQNKLSKYIKPGDLGYSYMPNELTIKACSSMKIFQYMQYGAVPVVSNVGDLPFNMFNGKAGYMAKHSNTEDLTQTFIRALSNKKERIDKIKYSQEHAVHKFSWKVLAEKLEKTYNSLLKN